MDIAPVYQSIKGNIPVGVYRCMQIRLVDNKTKDGYHLFTLLEKL